MLMDVRNSIVHWTSGNVFETTASRPLKTAPPLIFLVCGRSETARVIKPQRKGAIDSGGYYFRTGPPPVKASAPAFAETSFVP